MHTTWSDGAHSVDEMGEALIDQGYQYAVITDHSQYLKVANGLTPERLEKQKLEIFAFNEAYPTVPTIPRNRNGYFTRWYFRF